MNSMALISAIRSRSRALTFESPARAANIFLRLIGELPPSESSPGQAAIDVALGAIERTIASSRAAAVADEEEGHLVRFTREVSEEDQRWIFEVEVTVDRHHNAVITDARVISP